jgi:hypothetical protein
MFPMNYLLITVIRLPLQTRLTIWIYKSVSVFIFGKKLCRAYVIMLYTCRIKIKFSYLILCINLYISNPSLEKSTMIACINKNNEWPFPSRPLRLRPCHACSAKEQSSKSKQILHIDAGLYMAFSIYGWGIIPRHNRGLIWVEGL